MTDLDSCSKNLSVKDASRVRVRLWHRLQNAVWGRVVGRTRGGNAMMGLGKGLWQVERAADTKQLSRAHMRVNLRRLRAGMAEELLDMTQINAGLQEMG